MNGNYSCIGGWFYWTGEVHILILSSLVSQDCEWEKKKGVSSRTCVSMTYVNELAFVGHQHDEERTVLINFHVRATIIADLIVCHDVRDGSAATHIDALGNVALAVGDCGHWLTIHRDSDVHHGLLVIIPCRCRVREGA